ncbi:MAG: tRNA (adenosine(37)-N6)-threonylcarbamoyltransferase complex dimerization subunit type 1 TsaB [Bacillota bacterium]
MKWAISCSNEYWSIRKDDLVRVLGIDSATLVAGMAIVDEQRVVVEGFLQTRRTHSERLLPLIDWWMREAELSLADIDGIAVTNGPGSFTGLRIGMATAKGLAQATGKAFIGIPTLDALALNLAGSGVICPILDARKGEVYTALYISPAADRVIRLSNYVAVTPARLIDWVKTGTWPLLESSLEVYPRSDESIVQRINQWWPTAMPAVQPITFLGDAVPVYWEEIQQGLGKQANRALPGQNWLRAAQVAFLGLKALQHGQADDYRLVRPIYVRASEAELKLKGRCGGCN